MLNSKAYFWLLLGINIATFIVLVLENSDGSTYEFSGIPFLTISIAMSVGYLYFFRRRHLFCFETIFIIIYILSTYFIEIVIMNVGAESVISSVLKRSFSPTISNKALLLQSLGLYCFLLGETIENRKVRNIRKKFYISCDFSLCVHFMSIIVSLYLVYLFTDGTVSSWFHYSGNNNGEYTNTSIVYLTILCIVYTVFEFSRLYEKGVTSFKTCILRLNKIYFANISIISTLLLISGNRNEALLILLPPIIAYCIFIKYITNKMFLTLFTIGGLSMIIIGLTRQAGVSAENIGNSELKLYESTRDFAYVDLSTKYLIEYSDEKSPIYFNNAIINMFSSVPFMGGLYTDVMGTDYDTRSVVLTTEGMQSEQNKASGLGTSLIGDLYYTGSLIFVLLYMLLFGMLMAYLFNRFTIRRSYSTWLLIIYLFLFSNCIYCVRAEWTMPIRYIGFSFFITFIVASLTATVKTSKRLKYGK